jgi:hypothetical protein
MGPDTVQVIIDIVKAVGFSGIIFVIWVMTLKFFMHILDEQKKAFEESMARQKSSFDGIWEELSRRNKENFEILNKFASAVEYIGGQMSIMDGKIENNRFCPIMRDETRQPGAVH